MKKNTGNVIKLLFEFNENEFNGKNILFTKPVRIITTRKLSEVIPALSDVCNAVKTGLYAAGYIAYEAAPAFDPAYQVCSKGYMPLIWFALFESPEFIEQNEQSSFGSYNIGTWEPNITRTDYNQNIDKIKNVIAQGETYQVNYTIRLETLFEGDDLAFYRRLSRSQQGQFSAYLNIGSYRILSASPELFFRWENNILTTKPMKGTANRGLTVPEDRTLREYLFSSDKNRAENLMIVDLLRNDLGRVAKYGTVHVPELFEIEKYPTVYQMTSTIQAETRPETTLVDVFRALFPCGSITGAPKVSTMKIIAELEQVPREVYCGAIGYLSPKGKAVFSVPIRTVVINTEMNTAQYGVGGGITWDSTSEDEYNEILAKAALLNEERIKFDLLETMLLKNGNYNYLERHLKRLRGSAEYFSYSFSDTEIRERLKDHAQAHPAEARRVRLLLAENGKVCIESTPCTPDLNQSIKVVSIANQSINRNNRFLYHKTTYRRLYDEFKKARPHVFDVLLWNEDNELTEFTIGNIVLEIDGIKSTPPVSCGLLPGVFREELLARGEIVQRVLTREDLSRATRVWLINSLRGWVPVYLEGVRENH